MAALHAPAVAHRECHARRLQLPGLPRICPDAPGDALRALGVHRLRCAPQVRSLVSALLHGSVQGACRTACRSAISRVVFVCAVVPDQALHAPGVHTLCCISLLSQHSCLPCLWSRAVACILALLCWLSQDAMRSPGVHRPCCITQARCTGRPFTFCILPQASHLPSSDSACTHIPGNVSVGLRCARMRLTPCTAGDAICSSRNSGHLS